MQCGKFIDFWSLYSELSFIRAAGTYLNMENLEFKLTLPNLIAMELECSYLAFFGICLGLGILKYQDQIQELVIQPIKDALEIFGAYYGEAKDKILGLLADIKETAMSFKYKIKDGLELEKQMTRFWFS